MRNRNFPKRVRHLRAESRALHGRLQQNKCFKDDLYVFNLNTFQIFFFLSVFPSFSTLLTHPKKVGNVLVRLHLTLSTTHSSAIALNSNDSTEKKNIQIIFMECSNTREERREKHTSKSSYRWSGNNFSHHNNFYIFFPSVVSVRIWKKNKGFELSGSPGSMCLLASFSAPLTRVESVGEFSCT